VCVCVRACVCVCVSECVCVCKCVSVCVCAGLSCDNLNLVHTPCHDLVKVIRLYGRFKPL